MEDYYYFNISLDGDLMAQFRRFLKQFLRLSSVEVPITLLGLGPHDAEEVGNLLPNTLHELCLHWDCSELSSNPWWGYIQLYDVFQHLLVDLESHTLHLKRIAIRILDNKDPDRFQEERAETWAKCAQRGIKIEVFDELSPGLWTQNV